MNHAHAHGRSSARGVPPEIEDDTPAGDAARARARHGSLRPERPAILLRRAELRLLLRRSPLIAYDGEAAAALHDGRLHALDRARLPHAAPLAGRRPLALRRARPRLHAAALRPGRRRPPLLAAAAAPRPTAPVPRLFWQEAPGVYAAPLCCRGPTSTSPGAAAPCPATPDTLLDTITGTAAAAN